MFVDWNCCRSKVKRVNKATVLLTSDLLIGIDELILYRKKIGVNSKNAYIFAALTRNNSKHFRGNDCLTSLLQECPLKVPEELVVVPFDVGHFVPFIKNWNELAVV